MEKKALLAQQLDARAGASRSLAEAQSLHAQADALRRVRSPAPFSIWALYRN